MSSLEFTLQIVLFLSLMALLGVRAKVSPRASVLIRAAPAHVFGLVNPHHNKVQNWHSSSVYNELVDSERQIYKVTYVNRLTNGTTQTSNALFRVHACHAPHYLELHREGLEGRSLNNELLKITINTRNEAQGTRLMQQYDWGPRPLLSHILARADLWGGIYRLKGLAETGKPDEVPHRIISTSLSLFTAFLSLLAFAILVGWMIAGLLVVALFIHEMGHLVAYRLIGQNWGRLVFLPFLGAIAMPRLNFTTQGQAVFAALMGPGFSLPFAGLLYVLYTAQVDIPLWFYNLGIIIAVLNLFNLLPAEPLDGGVALRSIFIRLMGPMARYGLVIVGTIIVLAGIHTSQMLLIIFGALSMLINLRPRRIDTGLKPLTSWQLTAGLCCYAFITTSYIIMLRFFMTVTDIT